MNLTRSSRRALWMVVAVGLGAAARAGVDDSGVPTYPALKITTVHLRHTTPMPHGKMVGEIRLDLVGKRMRAETHEVSEDGTDHLVVYSVVDGGLCLSVRPSRKRATRVIVGRERIAAEVSHGRAGMDWTAGLDRRHVDFQFVRREKVGKVECDVWRGEQTFVTATPRDPRDEESRRWVTVWLRSGSGMPVKSQREERGKVRQTTEVVELNGVVDEGIFSCAVPAGYAVTDLQPGDD